MREALLNALIHRDYSFSGSIIINVNDKEMEFISIGGLLSGLSPEDIRNGISLSRNSRLSELFHRLHFIEAYGTGIRRIFSLYKECKAQPEISITPNSFKITLPNMNVAGKIEAVSDSKVVSGKKEFVPKLTEQMVTILDYISENGEITLEEIQNLLNIKETRTYVIMKQLINSGKVEKIGRGKGQKYIRKS